MFTLLIFVEKKRKINHSHTNLMARYSLDDALGDLAENLKIYHSCKSELSGTF